jgi:hypothetical protein
MPTTSARRNARRRSSRFCRCSSCRFHAIARSHRTDLAYDLATTTMLLLLLSEQKEQSKIDTDAAAAVMSGKLSCTTFLAKHLSTFEYVVQTFARPSSSIRRGKRAAVSMRSRAPAMAYVCSVLRVVFFCHDERNVICCVVYVGGRQTRSQAQKYNNNTHTLTNNVQPITRTTGFFARRSVLEQRTTMRRRPSPRRRPMTTPTRLRVRVDDHRPSLIWSCLVDRSICEQQRRRSRRRSVVTRERT